MLSLPPYKSFPVLKDEMVIMREIIPADAADIVDISVYDGKWAVTPDDVLSILSKIENDYRQGNSIHWGVADATNGHIVGTCGFYRGIKYETGEIGFILKPEFSGKGYMTAAVNLVVNFGLNNIGLDKVIAITSTNNYKAKKLLIRVGFKTDHKVQNGYLRYEYKYNYL